MNVMLNLFCNKKKGKRKGYFLIAFSLILVMLQVPIWVNMLSLDYKIKSEIKRWNESDYVTGLGNSIMQAELNKLSNNGPGFFAFNEPVTHTDTPSGEPLTVTYNFLGASVIPVPTGYNESDLSKSIIPGGPAVLDAVYANCANTVITGLCSTGPLMFGSTVVASSPKHIYTSPAMGTGNAGSECQPGQIRKDLYYPVEGTAGETLMPVDPLDDPCQWDKIALGQTVAIPLFILDPEDQNKVHVFDPDTLVLRVRKPCITPGQEICKGEDRWVSVLDNRGPQHDILSNVVTDYSDRILDIALVANKFMLPDIAYDRGVDGVVNPRSILSNREVTEKRLMHWGGATFRLDPGFGQANLPTLVNDRTSIVNLAGIGFSDLLATDNSKYIWLSDIKLTSDKEGPDDFGGIFEIFDPNSVSFPFYKNAESIFDSTNACTKLFTSGCLDETSRFGAKIVGDKSPESPEDPFVPPYLVIKMINNMFEVTDGMGKTQLLQNMEFQLVSNKPLGNTRNAIYGYAEYMGQEYRMKNHLGKQKNLEIVKETGVVFSN
jgi:hypothetical protein